MSEEIWRTNRFSSDQKHLVIFYDDGRTEVCPCAEEGQIRQVGDCGQGCCTDYICSACDGKFRVEWPD